MEFGVLHRDRIHLESNYIVLPCTSIPFCCCRHAATIDQSCHVWFAKTFSENSEKFPQPDSQLQAQPPSLVSFLCVSRNPTRISVAFTPSIWLMLSSDSKMDPFLPSPSPSSHSGTTKNARSGLRAPIRPGGNLKQPPCGFRASRRAVAKTLSLVTTMNLRQIRLKQPS